MNLPQQLIISAIRLYQRTLSPDHGWFKSSRPYGYCRYVPSCSEYAIASIRSYGAVRGLLLSVGRIARCNPWSRGGYDPVR